jgi:hypothetical protein
MFKKIFKDFKRNDVREKCSTFVFKKKFFWGKVFNFLSEVTLEAGRKEET